MSNHIKIDEDFVASLLATAKWDHPLQLQEEVQEEVIVEEHTCPLCESELDEELSDEIILEHLDAIQDILTEKKDVDDEDDDDDEEEVDEQEEEPEEEEEEAPEVNASKKAKVRKKVKELKEKWAGEKNGDDSKEDDDDNGDSKAFGGKKGDKSKTKKGKDFEKKG